MNKSYITDGVLIKYEKESSKLRLSGGSWTINVDKFDLGLVNRIVYITEGFKYNIDKDDAINVGYFRNLGGENKLVVPIKNWKRTAK